MLSIGEFAGMTGLSVKALRHYDEKGVLVPNDVDGQTGYRRYAEDKVRSGVVVRALRDAAVPLTAVTKVVRGGDPQAVLAASREQVLADRAREDRAFDAACQVLAALSAPVEVIERTCAARPYVGRLLTVPADEDESLTDEMANEQFKQLFETLQAEGLGPSGQFWTTLRSGDQGQVEILCCWPTLVQVDPDWGGSDTMVGTLPDRTELVATWRAEEDQSFPEGATHPAVVALFDALAEQDVDLRGTEVRQSMVGQDEQNFAVEVVVTMVES